MPLDLSQPRVPESSCPVGRWSPNEGHEGVRICDNISEDGDLSLGDLVHVLGEGLEVGNTPTQDHGGSSSRGEGVNFTCHTAIQSDAKGNDWSSASPGWHTQSRVC